MAEKFESWAEFDEWWEAQNEKMSKIRARILSLEEEYERVFYGVSTKGRELQERIGPRPTKEER